MSDKFWIGVDLDRTLAYYEGWHEQGHVIGEPIGPMLTRVRDWIEAGWTVKIFTARAAAPSQIPIVKRWLLKYGLGDLEVTNQKDGMMVALWDDRAVSVEPNTGIPVIIPEHLKGI